MGDGNILRTRIQALTLCVLLIFSILATPLSAENLNYQLEYDQNGNIIKSTDQYYEYDDFNQLITIRQDDAQGQVIAEFLYDPQGNRIAKIEHKNNKQTTTFYPDPSFIRVVNDSGKFDTQFYHHNGQLVAKKDDKKTLFYHPDLLGSTQLVTDQDAQPVEQTSYLPFGEVDQDGQSRFLFTGKEQDESGLYYYGARYYDPQLRQFTQPDQVIPDVYNPQDLNRYAYVRNNPYRYTDPTGNYLSPLDIADYASLAHSIYSVAQNPTSGQAWGFLAADLIASAIPGLGGAGLLLKGGTKVDDIADGAKFISKESEITADVAGKASADLVASKSSKSLSVEQATQMLEQVTIRAEKQIGGKGPVQGTLKHSAIGREVIDLGHESTLIAEKSFKDGRLIQQRAKGSVRPDFLLGSTSKPSAVLEVKTGPSSAKLRPGSSKVQKRVNQLSSNLPNAQDGVDVVFVTPHGSFKGGKTS